MDMILSIPKINQHFFPVDATVLFANVTSKNLSFFTSCNFSRVNIINFPSCHIPQVNHCQDIISCLIMKINVQKQKQGLVLFHLLETMITL